MKKKSYQQERFVYMVLLHGLKIVETFGLLLFRIFCLAFWRFAEVFSARDSLFVFYWTRTMTPVWKQCDALYYDYDEAYQHELQ